MTFFYKRVALCVKMSSKQILRSWIETAWFRWCEQLPHLSNWFFSINIMLSLDKLSTTLWLNEAVTGSPIYIVQPSFPLTDEIFIYPSDGWKRIIASSKTQYYTAYRIHSTFSASHYFQLKQLIRSIILIQRTIWFHLDSYLELFLYPVYIHISSWIGQRIKSQCTRSCTRLSEPHHFWRDSSIKSLQVLDSQHLNWRNRGHDCRFVWNLVAVYWHIQFELPVRWNNCGFLKEEDPMKRHISYQIGPFFHGYVLNILCFRGKSKLFSITSEHSLIQLCVLNILGALTF